MKKVETLEEKTEGLLNYQSMVVFKAYRQQPRTNNRKANNQVKKSIRNKSIDEDLTKNRQLKSQQPRLTAGSSR